MEARPTGPLSYSVLPGDGGGRAHGEVGEVWMQRTVWHGHVHASIPACVHTRANDKHKRTHARARAHTHTHTHKQTNKHGHAHTRTWHARLDTHWNT